MAEAAALSLDQRDVFDDDGLFDFLGLMGAERTRAALVGVPFFELANGTRRYLRDQVITWAARGGCKPRPLKRSRSLTIQGDA